MEMRTFNYQDLREYSVQSETAPAPPPEGRVLIADASHPSRVTVNEEFSWYVVGHVEDALVHNPGVAYVYLDGPANSITLVGADGSRDTLEKGTFMTIYYHADKDPCTNVDSRDVYRGAIFPAEGTYTIWLLSGYLSEDEAAAGLPTLAGLMKLKSRHLAGFAGFPVRVSAAQAISIAGPILLGLGLLLVKR